MNVSIWTRQKHCQFDEKKAPIPYLIWSDGHTEWSRWYWFKDNDISRVANPYCHFK